MTGPVPLPERSPLLPESTATVDPAWLEQAIRRREDNQARRAELQAARDHGLQRRHRARLARANQTTPPAPADQGNRTEGAP